jgi:outer membrane immunogenic protein
MTGWNATKNFILGSTTIFVLGSSALAADMPLKAPMLASPPVVYRWTGCYIGGNVGGGWAKTEHQQIAKVAPPAAIVPPNDFGTSDGSDIIGGGQVGCDYQMGSWVIGGRGMFDFGHIKSSAVVPTAFPGLPVGSFNSQNTTKDIFTATARLGYLFTPQLLGYVQGGGAWARIDHSFFGAGPPPFLSESAIDINRSGWTVGGGLEWMFLPGWSLFGEFNHMDFGRRDTAYTRGPLAVVGSEDVIRTKLTAQQALVGVNFKFGWPMP